MKRVVIRLRMVAIMTILLKIKGGLWLWWWWWWWWWWLWWWWWSPTVGFPGANVCLGKPPVYSCCCWRLWWPVWSEQCDQCGQMIILRHSHHNHKFCLLLIAHGDDSKHQVDQVEGSEEDDDGEEDDMDRSPCCHHLTIDWVLTIGLGGDVLVR